MLGLRSTLALAVAALVLVSALVLPGLGSRVVHASSCSNAAGALKGVDVSLYQGTIDWTQVKQGGISFGYALANDGAGFSDPTFQTNFAAMKSAGVARGATLFFHADQDPIAQADALLLSLTQAGFTYGDLLPVIDVELTGGQSPQTLIAHLQTAVDTVKTRLGVAPVIYTSPGFWDGSAGGSNAFAAVPLWVANWGVTCPSLPQGWSTWSLWQYADNGSVSGIGATVDLDRTYGPTLPIYNAPPDCSAVVASPNVLWPPDHTYQTITLSGLTDADGDATTLTITGVSQDEPLSGDQSPDAAWGASSNTIQLRAERSAQGDGRVYRIAFTGTDAAGLTCTNTVTVGVPHDQSGAPVVDSGGTFNSFGPTPTPTPSPTSSPTPTPVTLPPTVSGFTPTSGPVGTLVTITGKDLTVLSGANVQFTGCNAASSALEMADGSLTITVPSCAQTGPLTVLTAGGSATSALSFTVV
jgi:lysozyme